MTSSEMTAPPDFLSSCISADCTGDCRNGRIKLFWLATGKDDFILPSTKGTLAVFDRSGIKYTYKETEGGHTWPNWRAYLAEFAPMLFR